MDEHFRVSEKECHEANDKLTANKCSHSKINPYRGLTLLILEFESLVGMDIN